MAEKNRSTNWSNLPQRLFRDIYTAQNNEIQCDRAEIDIALSTEAGLTDAQSQQRYPALWRHFQVCQNCYEEYQLLTQLAQLEATHQLVRPSHIPVMPVNTLPLQERLRNAITSLFAGFPPLVMEAIQRGATTGTAPVSVSLAEGKVTIVLDIEISEEEEEEDAVQQYNLFCAIETEDPAIKAALEASPIWLEIGDSGVLVQEKTLDFRGKATFTNLAPGTYLLQLRLATQLYAVLDFNIPERDSGR